MSDGPTTESATALAAAVKVLSWPAAIGIMAGAIGFLFMWPKTRAEGFSRILVSALCSHFFGDALLSTALHFLPWIAAKDMTAACYLVVGLPSWWILGWVFNRLQGGQNRTVSEVIKDIKELA
jgi:hypothetical protein